MTNGHRTDPSTDPSAPDALTDQELDQVNGGVVHQAVAVGHRHRATAQHDKNPYAGGATMDTQPYPSSACASRG